MLKVGVFGCGVMGSNHARIAAQSQHFDLVAVVDPDIGRARTLAAAFDALGVSSSDDIIGQLDAAIVAVPTEFHFDLASSLIRAGVHTLIEKPLALTTEQAQALADIAQQHDVTVTVGHVERFNPAVLELDNVVRDPVHITATRVSPYSPRISSGVVSDLMVHDLDIVAQLAGADVSSVSALTQNPRSESEDLAVALVRFANGVTATLTASRIGQQKIREITVSQPDSFVVVDLLRQDVTIHRVDHSEYSDREGMRFRQTGVVEIPFLEHRGEPLALEIDEFARAIREQRSPRVSVRDGVRAVSLVERVLAAAKG